MANLDQNESLCNRASTALVVGFRDAQEGRKERSRKKIEELILAGDEYRVGHALFIRHAYRIGRFNWKRQEEEAQRG